MIYNIQNVANKQILRQTIYALANSASHVVSSCADALVLACSFRENSSGSRTVVQYCLELFTRSNFANVEQLAAHRTVNPTPEALQVRILPLALETLLVQQYNEQKSFKIKSERGTLNAEVQPQMFEMWAFYDTEKYQVLQQEPCYQL